MKYVSFKILDFKGIKSMELVLDASPKSSVYTFVGLNESGKTTVLESINYFYAEREPLKDLTLPGYRISDPHEIIPIPQRSNFNGQSGVQAVLEPESMDHAIAESVIGEFGLTIVEKPTLFKKSVWTRFQNSRFNGQANQWYIDYIVEDAKGNRKELKYYEDAFAKVILAFEQTLPSILYFPNFLFDFPDRIYLSNPPENAKKHELYRFLIQDVLDSIMLNLDVGTHIVDRAFSSSDSDKRALESVLLKVADSISENVFNTWDRIFSIEQGGKSVVVTWGVERASMFLQLKIKENGEIYEISERSMGFRWFFAFLLFTYYRGFRKEPSSGVLFLFDEPASNLHSSAQQQLLDSFSRFPAGCTILYTTHSHHMISPRWLEGCYIVKNEAVNYTEADNRYTSRKSQVTLMKYREFASKHADQTTYFQPILDVLSYKPSNLELIRPTCILEGKSDYYFLSWADSSLKILDQSVLMPCTSASSMDSLISLFVGWGKAFLVILDSDKEGVAQKKRYLESFGEVVAEKIYTLSDILESNHKVEIEDLLDKDERSTITRSCYPDAKENDKKTFCRACQEHLMLGHKFEISDESSIRISRILTFIDNYFKDRER